MMANTHAKGAPTIAVPEDATDCPERKRAARSTPAVAKPAVESPKHISPPSAAHELAALTMQTPQLTGGSLVQLAGTVRRPTILCGGGLCNPRAGHDRRSTQQRSVPPSPQRPSRT